MKNMMGMLKQAQKLKREMDAIEVEGTAGRGAVKVTVNGQMKVKSVLISPEIITRGDALELGETVRDAVNEACGKAQKQAAMAMTKMSGGLPSPF